MFKKIALAAVLASASIIAHAENDSHDQDADERWCQQTYGQSCAAQEHEEKQQGRVVGGVRG